MRAPLSMVAAMGLAIVLGGFSAPAMASPRINTPADCPVVEALTGPLPFTDMTGIHLPSELADIAYDCVFDTDGLDPESESTTYRYRLFVLNDPTREEFEDLVVGIAESEGWLTLGVSTIGPDFFPLELAGIDEMLDRDVLDSAVVSFQTPGTPGLPPDLITVFYAPQPADPIDAIVMPFRNDPDNVGVDDFRITPVNAAYAAIEYADSPPLYEPIVPPGLGLNTPSVLSELNTVDEAVSPQQVAFASGGAVVLGLLMVFPSRLLSAVKDQLAARGKARFAAWRAARILRRTGKAPAVKPIVEPKRFSGWPLALAGLFIAAVLTVFVDPRAGFDLGTLRLAGSVFAAFVLDVGIGWLGLTLVVSRLVPAAIPRFQFKAWTFMLVVGAVLFSRVVELEPGITVGLVSGIVFGGALAVQQRVRLTLGVLGYGFVLAIAAWITYSALSTVSGWNEEGWSIFVHEALAAVTVAGLVALPLALLPVRGLTGFDIFRSDKRVWAISYALALGAFLFVLVPLPSSWTSVPLSFWGWLALFALYAVVAVAAWLIVIQPWKAGPDGDAEEPVQIELAASQR